jgi:RNA polymerase sigma-70 factor (ECF subfamily)
MLKFSKKDRQDEFLNLMDLHQGIVIKVCRMYTTTKDDYEDLYQEVIIQSWQSFSRFKGDSKFSTWLYKVSLNTALTRKKKGDPNKNTDEINEEKTSLYGSEVNGYETQDLIEKSMALLSETDRAFLVLYLDGYPYEEIAEMMGLSVSNTGVKINRIKNKLKGLLTSKSQ